MPSFDINNFRSNLKFGGARTNLFVVTITNPVDGTADLDVPIKCTATGLPAYTSNIIEIPYFGRRIKVAGNRVFEDWTVTIINDEDFKIRDAMETWVNAVNSPEGNVRNLASSSPALYKSEATVQQLSQTGQVLRTYKFVGIFPTQVSGMELNWGDDAVEYYNVTFSVDYFVVDDDITGNAGGV